MAHVVEHGADFSVHCTDNEEITDAKSAILDQDSRYGPTALINTRLEDRSASRNIWIGFQFQQIAHEQNHFEESRDILFRFRRDFHHYRVAAPFFRHQLAIRKLALHALRFGAWLINLV